MPRRFVAILLAVICSAFTFAQSQTSASTQESVVPQLVNFSGTLTDAQGKPLTALGA